MKIFVSTTSAEFATMGIVKVTKQKSDFNLLDDYEKD